MSQAETHDLFLVHQNFQHDADQALDLIGRAWSNTLILVTRFPS